MSRVTRRLLLYIWFWSSFGQAMPALQVEICSVTAAEDIELAKSPQSLSKQNCLDFASTFPLSVNHNFWLRTRLPDTIPLDHILVIDNGFEDLEVFVGSTLIYRYGFFDRSLRQVVSQRSHMINLNQSWAGADLFIRAHIAYSFMAQPKPPRIVSALDYHQEHLVQTWKTAVFVGLLIAVGLVAWAIAISYLVFGVFAFFGFFAMAVAGWITFNQFSPFGLLLSMDPTLQARLDMLCVFGAAATMMYCAGTILNMGRKSWRAIVWPSSIFFVSCLVCAWNPLIHPWYALPVFHMIVLSSVPILGWSALQNIRKGNRESRILAGGLISVYAGATHDVFLYTNWFDPDRIKLMNTSVAVFFLTLIVSLALRYRRERREALVTSERLLARIQLLNEDLEAHVRKVDALVDNKTRDIRSIMQSIEIGICLVDAHSLKVGVDYSAYLERILERKNLAGNQVMDILPIDAETKLSLDKVLQGLRESNRGDFDFHEPSLPTQLAIIRHDQSHREVDLSWHPICGENGTIERFLLTITDVTILRKLERSAREKASELSKLNRYINEHVLQRFFPPDLVQDLVDGKANFDDRAKGMTITVLLTDLSSFTKATETLGPDRIATILNSYFVRMTDIAFAAGGTIDKFMGDGILILFGAPREMPAADQVNRACRCAQEMQIALDELNRTWDLGDIEDFHLRTAVSHGPAIVGSFGGKKRSDFTAIGTTVNIAARISQISKPDEILMNREAAQYIPSERLQSAGLFKLKGVANEVELFRYKTANAEAEAATA